MPRQSDHLAATLERHTAALQRRQSAEAVDTDPFNTDEWDPSRGAFWQHAVAAYARCADIADFYAQV